jgi:outer membrane lipopolysaccharide assembly protein LptE/RlpB
MRVLAILLATFLTGCATQLPTEMSASDALAKLAKQSNVAFSSTDVEQKGTLRIVQPF